MKIPRQATNPPRWWWCSFWRRPGQACLACVAPARGCESAPDQRAAPRRPESSQRAGGVTERVVLCVWMGWTWVICLSPQCTFNPDDLEDNQIAMNMLSTWVGDWVWDITNKTVAYKLIEQTLCNTAFVLGDQVEAASPLDVTFWPIHPTMDRLLQYKRVVNDFTFANWSSPHGATVYCVTAQCKGHHGFDLTPIETSYERPDGSYVLEQLSNHEILRMTHPREYQMPYIYDNFRWDHCEEEGYAFPGAPATESASSAVPPAAESLRRGGVTVVR